MHEPILIQLVAILVLGVSAQWLAFRLRLPSILLLLGGGFLAGPTLGLLSPDEVFGELLFPVVSAFVALILFEGGLSLSLREFREVGRVVRNLVTIGVAVTWVLTTCATRVLLEFSWNLSLLLGAILVVTGPTVIVPLLRHVRPSGRVAALAKWEGMVNDPIGAVLAVLVFEALVIGPTEPLEAVFGMTRALGFGAVLGGLGAALLTYMLSRFLIPDFLQNAFTLMVVLAVYVIANELQSESGLVGVTLMGFALANQRYVDVRHIVEFKENIRVLLLSALFVLLSARVPSSALDGVGWPSLGLLVVLILFIRPAAVLASTVGSDATLAERAFLCLMAPRGIVAAAVSAIFAYRLTAAGSPNADALVPVTLLVIVGTSAVYGLAAAPLTRKLGLANRNPNGLIFVGADAWTRDMASSLKDVGADVLLVDNDRRKVAAARQNGLRAVYTNVLSERALEDIDLSGVASVVALTSNDEVNALVALHFIGSLGRDSVFQIAPDPEVSPPSELPRHLRGRYAFSTDVHYADLEARARAGYVVRSTSLTEQFRFRDYREEHDSSALPLFIVRHDGGLETVRASSEPEPRPGDTVVAMLPPSAPAKSGKTSVPPRSA